MFIAPSIEPKYPFGMREQMVFLSISDFYVIHRRMDEAECELFVLTSKEFVNVRISIILY